MSSADDPVTVSDPRRPAPHGSGVCRTTPPALRAIEDANVVISAPDFVQFIGDNVQDGTDAPVRAVPAT